MEMELPVLVVLFCVCVCRCRGVLNLCADAGGGGAKCQESRAGQRRRAYMTSTAGVYGTILLYWQGSIRFEITHRKHTHTDTTTMDSMFSLQQRCCNVVLYFQ